MDGDEPVVEIAGLCKRYRQVLAVDRLDLAVPRGEIFGLIGKNGAGKTTTIAMLLGLVTPTAGRIRIFGLDPGRSRTAVLQRMSFSSPYVDLPHRLTVRQNLRVYAELYGVRAPCERIDAVCGSLGITDIEDRRYGRLSSGQKTRVALAKAMLNEPELLLLDEPTVSLDPDVADRVRTWLADYRDRTGATIVVTSHNMAEVERICDRLLILKRGRSVAEGTPAAVVERFGRQNLEQVFLDIAREEQDR